MASTSKNLLLCADVLSDRPEARVARALLCDLVAKEWEVEVRPWREDRAEPAGTILDPTEQRRIAELLEVRVPCGSPALVVASLAPTDGTCWVRGFCESLDACERMIWIVRPCRSLPAGIEPVLPRYDRFFVPDPGSAEVLFRAGVPGAKVFVEGFPQSLTPGASPSARMRGVSGDRGRMPSLPSRHREPEQRHPRARPLVVLEGPIFELSSAALFQRATLGALLARDEVDVAVRPTGEFRWPACEGPPLTGLPERVLERPRARPDLWIRSGWPPRSSRPDAARWVVRFDWEYGALPRCVADTFTHQVDEVWTHSRAVATTCTAGGVPTAKVRVVPHGVDPHRFRPGLAPLPEIARIARGATVILFVGEAIWRKGIDLLLSAYGQSFKAADPVLLVVKELGSGTSYPGFSLTEAVARFAACPGAPRMLHLREPIPGERMGSLYAAADFLVHPYRGEGFGLPVLEARACGLPVLVTRGGATDDFTRGAACVGLTAQRRNIPLPEPTVGPAWVLEPDLDELKQRLRLMVQAAGSLREIALAAAESVAREFSWDRVARTIAESAYGQGTEGPDSNECGATSLSRPPDPEDPLSRNAPSLVQ